GAQLTALRRGEVVFFLPGEAMRHRFATRVRLHHHDTAPAYLPLALFRGVAGIAFLCFGELFWMHLSRIGLTDEAQVLGSIALILGSVMAVGALCGAAGHSFSEDDGGRLPRLGAVYLCAPLSVADLMGAITFTIKRAEVRRRKSHAGGGGRPHRGGAETIVPGSPEDTPQSRAESFRKLYDTFLFLALACSMLEAIMFRFGRRHIGAANAERRRRYRRGGTGPGVSESLLDEEDVRDAAEGWEDWRGESQRLLMEQRYEQLRRNSLEKSEGLLEHTRGGKNSL
ncbi:unnamed protein product, partial [Scytosiphon promiscuus]